jgi:hypothetical protein
LFAELNLEESTWIFGLSLSSVAFVSTKIRNHPNFHTKQISFKIVFTPEKCELTLNSISGSIMLIIIKWECFYKQGRSTLYLNDTMRFDVSDNKDPLSGISSQKAFQIIESYCVVQVVSRAFAAC